MCCVYVLYTIFVIQASTKEGGKKLQLFSQKVEDAVVELIALLQETALLPKLHNLDSTEVAQSKKGEFSVCIV